MSKTKVTLIAGDGIGPEVAKAAVRVLDASGAELEWEPQVAGAEAVKQFNDPQPADRFHVLGRINDLCHADAAVFESGFNLGPLGSGRGGFVSGCSAFSVRQRFQAHRLLHIVSLAAAAARK